MNYTKLVREYCKNNSGAIFDVSKLKDTEFSEVPYKTLLKILNRLEEEGLQASAARATGMSKCSAAVQGYCFTSCPANLKSTTISTRTSPTSIGVCGIIPKNFAKNCGIR